MKSLNLLLGSLALLFVVSTSAAQHINKARQGSFALTNATIITVTQDTVTGHVVIEDGRITGVGDVNPPSGIEQMNCEGLFVYPGMIDAGSQLGLEEVGSISLTLDHNELGDLRPQMKALTAVNPNSTHIPVTRVNGITTALVVPSGGRLPGTASLINLVGYTPEQMYAGFDAIVLNFPRTGKTSSGDRRSDEEREKAEKKAMESLNEYWKSLTLYHQIDSLHRAGKGEEPAYNPALEAALGAFRGEQVVLIEVDRDKDIESALEWIKGKNIKVVLTGVSEGWRVADQIASAKIPVITGPVLSMPTRTSDRYDRAYANAGLMLKAGVQVALRTNDSENARNLPYHAGFAATYGMGPEAALRAVTIEPARIFGVADQLGSIEVNKVANLFVSDGDPFETKTQIKHLFISGSYVPLESRQTYLYDEFLDRDSGAKKD